MIILVSCGGNRASKLIGTWKVIDVQTEFQETEVTSEMLRQVVEQEKQTYFRIVNDSIMVIISSNNIYEARWIFDDESGEITYFFEGRVASGNSLGRLEDNRVVHESQTPLGKITTIYSKK